jgi:hypothetical protein
MKHLYLFPNICAELLVPPPGRRGKHTVCKSSAFNFHATHGLTTSLLRFSGCASLGRTQATSLYALAACLPPDRGKSSERRFATDISLQPFLPVGAPIQPSSLSVQSKVPRHHLPTLHTVYGRTTSRLPAVRSSICCAIPSPRTRSSILQPHAQFRLQSESLIRSIRLIPRVHSAFVSTSRSRASTRWYGATTESINRRPDEPDLRQSPTAVLSLHTPPRHAALPGSAPNTHGLPIAP